MIISELTKPFFLNKLSQIDTFMAFINSIEEVVLIAKFDKKLSSFKLTKHSEQSIFKRLPD